jgi:hypothetical protein
MITLYELLRVTQVEILAELERRWGNIQPSYQSDNRQFIFFDKLMKQTPRKGRG